MVPTAKGGRVYIVALGEHGEGHDPLKSFSSYDKAMHYCSVRWGKFPEEEIEDGEVIPGVWRMTIEGSDEVVIYKMKVE